MIKHMLCAFAALFIHQPVSREGVTALSNEASPTPADCIGIANEIPLGENVSKEWLKIPYGNFDHSKGMQVFDKAAALAMANEFNATVPKLLRWATGNRGGAPVYIGHPDDPAFANEYKDKRAHGWIKELRADEDGLALRVAWNKLGSEVLSNEEFRFFSPRWDAKPVAGKSRQFTPVGLISAGLTNQPNIPVQPLSNEDAPMMPLADWLAEALGIPVDASKEDILAAIAAKVESGAKAADKAKADAVAKMEGETKAKETAELALENERKSHRALILSNAVTAKKITAAQVPEWERKLATDFANESKALAAISNTLPAGGKTNNLGQRKPSGAVPTLATLANEIAAREKIPFAAAWQKAVQQQTNPAA